LVHQAIDSVVQKTCSSGNLLKLLVAVHVAYDGVKAHVQQFKQLASMEPSIVDVLIKTVPYPAAEMVCVVHYIITCCSRDCYI